MRTTLMSAAVTAAVLTMSMAAQADEVKGGARADFAADELVVPCVAIEGYSEAADGTYYDLIFDRRGKSFNYELKFGEPEDASVCEELANYALFIDDDADDEEGDPEDDIFASCEVKVSGEDQIASSIKIKAKDLEEGEYYAEVTSGVEGGVTVSSDSAVVEDEAEFEFSSDESDVADGAVAIEAGFIVENTVTAELLLASDDSVVLSETVTCRVEEEEAEEGGEGDPA